MNTEWENILLGFAKEHDAEILKDNNHIIIITATEVEENNKTNLQETIPEEYTIDFTVGSKSTTIQLIDTLIIYPFAHFMNTVQVKNNCLDITLKHGVAEMPMFLVKLILTILKTDEWYTSLKVGDKVYNIKEGIHTEDKQVEKPKPSLVTYTEKPTNKITVINDNDVTDLKITLETCQDVTEFINSI